MTKRRVWLRLPALAAGVSSPSKGVVLRTLAPERKGLCLGPRPPANECGASCLRHGPDACDNGRITLHLLIEQKGFMSGWGQLENFGPCMQSQASETL